MNATIEEAEAHAKQSIKENRVYVGNLSYTTTYKDLEKFCKKGGWIWIFIRSGCGVVRVDLESGREGETEYKDRKGCGGWRNPFQVETCCWDAG
jgi:hypothetical protein